jgi:hypothetical protein
MQPEESPDPRWVSELTGCSPARAARRLEEAREERGLFAHLTREHRKEGRRSYIEIDAPLELHAIVREMRPSRVVEVGVSSGVSTAYLLQALARNKKGRLHSIDLASHPRPSKGRQSPSQYSWTLPPGRTAGWAVPRALKDRWVLHEGDKHELLPVLARELSRIDLFVYDVPHECTEAYQEFRAVDRRLPEGGVAIADHGPGGSLCPALARWAKGTGAKATRRSGLGLYGFAKSKEAPLRPGRSLLLVRRRAEKRAPGTRSN